MRHVDGRHAEVSLDPRDLGSHLDAELRVEVRERLVHEERLRIAHDRAAHRDPLALTAGERPRLLLQRLREPQNPCGFADATVDLVFRETAHLEGEAHVLVRIHVWIERVVLEDHRDVAILRREVVHDLSVDLDGARGDRLETRHHPERGRLPAPRRPDEDDELAGCDLEVQRGDGFGPVGIYLRQLVENDLRHGVSSCRI